MLGLKSFRSATITLAGIELAHRIRKQQYSLPMGMNGRARSLKAPGRCTGNDSDLPERSRDQLRQCTRTQERAPEMAARAAAHRRAGSISAQDLPSAEVCICSFGPRAGGTGTTSTDTAGKRKTLSLGTYPDVPTALAQARHAARGGCSPRASIRRCGGANAADER
jgi:hypothetical protein